MQSNVIKFLFRKKTGMDTYRQILGVPDVDSYSSSVQLCCWPIHTCFTLSSVVPTHAPAQGPAGISSLALGTSLFQLQLATILFPGVAHLRNTCSILTWRFSGPALEILIQSISGEIWILNHSQAPQYPLTFENCWFGSMACLPCDCYNSFYHSPPSFL